MGDDRRLVRPGKRAGRTFALWLAALLFAAAFLGCTGNQYTEDEKAAAGEKGRKMMQEWLERELPGAELLGAEPYIFHNPGLAPYKLTDLVSGTFRKDGQEQAYWLNTSSGEVWLEQSRETMEELEKLCSECAAEALGFHSGDYRYESESGGVYFDIGVRDRPLMLLPAGFVLSGKTLEEFLRAPNERPALNVSLCYSVPDEVSLAGFTLADFRRVLEEYGLEGSVCLDNGSESLSMDAGEVRYERWGFLDLPDFRVWAAVTERSEKADPETGEITAETLELDAQRDLAVERTAEGWKTTFPGGYFFARVYAYDDSPLLEQTLVWRAEGEGQSDGDRPLYWKETDLGWALTFCDREEPCSLSEEYLIAVKNG